MPNNTPPDTYQSSYTKVEQNTEYEYRTKYYFHAGIPIPSYYRRKFETRTYEATLTEKLPNGSGQYDHDAAIPTEANAKTVVGDNEISGDAWKLQSIEYTKSLSTPLTRDIRITFIKHYSWEHIDVSESI